MVVCVYVCARASCLTCRHVAAIHGSNEEGKYCSSGFAAFSRLNRDINYLLYLLTYFTSGVNVWQPMVT